MARQVYIEYSSQYFIIQPWNERTQFNGYHQDYDGNTLEGQEDLEMAPRYTSKYTNQAVV